MGPLNCPARRCERLPPHDRMSFLWFPFQFTPHSQPCLHGLRSCQQKNLILGTNLFYHGWNCFFVARSSDLPLKQYTTNVWPTDRGPTPDRQPPSRSRRRCWSVPLKNVRWQFLCSKPDKWVYVQGLPVIMHIRNLHNHTHSETRTKTYRIIMNM